MKTQLLELDLFYEIYIFPFKHSNYSCIKGQVTDEDTVTNSMPSNIPKPIPITIPTVISLMYIVLKILIYIFRVT